MSTSWWHETLCPQTLNATIWCPCQMYTIKLIFLLLHISVREPCLLQKMCEHFSQRNYPLLVALTVCHRVPTYWHPLPQSNGPFLFLCLWEYTKWHRTVVTNNSSKWQILIENYFQRKCQLFTWVPQWNRLCWSLLKGVYIASRNEEQTRLISACFKLVHRTFQCSWNEQFSWMTETLTLQWKHPCFHWR